MRALLLATILATVAACGSNGTPGPDGSGGSGSGDSGGSAGTDAAVDAAAGGDVDASAGGIDASATGADTGIDVSAGGDSGRARACGGRTGVQCGPREWCDYPDNSCGRADQQGVCRELVSTQNCGTTFVCGCDGQAYVRDCDAYAFHTDITGDKSCIAGNGGNGAPCERDADCQSGFSCCGGGARGLPHACTMSMAGHCPLVP